VHDCACIIYRSGNSAQAIRLSLNLGLSHTHVHVLDVGSARSKRIVHSLLVGFVSPPYMYMYMHDMHDMHVHARAHRTFLAEILWYNVHIG
jgi:hypothetical protein